MSEPAPVSAPVSVAAGPVGPQPLSPEERAIYKERMRDPLWRIRHIYRIKDKQGNVIPFRPNWVQAELLQDLYVRGHRRLVVLKSRKHGVSTLFELVIFDWCYFGEHLQASIVDLTHGNASDKLVNIVRFVWDHLSPEAKQALSPDSSTVIGFANGSAIHAGKNARGGQNQLLHVSEWGPIAHEDPERSTEIKTGALPSADEGIQLIESTFKGGKGGDFYDLIKRAQETPPEQRTNKDFVFRFFAWWQDSRNTLEGRVEWISKPVRKYLDELEAKLGVQFTDGQRVWYFKTKQEQGIFMAREYPSTVEEAFSAPVEGAIFGEIMSEIRAAGHMLPVISWDRSVPVFACWDIGWDDCTGVWLVQIIGRDVVWLAYDEQRHVNASQMFMQIEMRGIVIAGHLLPHDGRNHAPGSGTSYEEELLKAGAVNIVIIERSVNPGSDINLMRDMLARSWFAIGACQRGIDAFESYHTKDKMAGGSISKEAVHDWSSHAVSAAIKFAQGVNAGMVKEALAKKVLYAPRGPGGEVLVDHDHITQRRARQMNMLAKSGSRRA